MSLKKFQQAMNVLRMLDPNMPMATVSAFVEICQHDDIEMKDLQERADLSYSSLSRAVASLSDKHWIKKSNKEGLGRIETFESEEDRRRKLVRLTQKGRSMKSTIEELLT